MAGSKNNEHYTCNCTASWHRVPHVRVSPNSDSLWYSFSILTACLSVPLYVGWHSPPLPARAAVSSARLDSTSVAAPLRIVTAWLQHFREGLDYTSLIRVWDVTYGLVQYSQRTRCSSAGVLYTICFSPCICTAYYAHCQWRPPDDRISLFQQQQKFDDNNNNSTDDPY